MASHNCPYCNQLVPDENPYCGKCGGPQTYQPKGSAVKMQLDPWLITARDARNRFQGDDEAVRALVNTWRNDPEFDRTKQIQQEIDEGINRGDLVKTDAYYYCCPWSPVYNVNRDVSIGGKRISRGQQFVVDVSAEAIPSGGKFKREIMIGNFTPTDRVDYCLPGQGGE